MAIEFRCTACQKLLRVGDDTAGKQAKCPNCGAVLTIPLTSAAPPDAPGSNPFGDLSPAAPLPGASFGQPDTGFAPNPEETQNPYQSPQASIDAPPFSSNSGPRSGPPWEREGASWASFVATIKGCFTSPTVFYDDMRREGGLGGPLWFGIAGGSAGVIAAMLFNIVIQGIMAAATGQNDQFTVQLIGGGCYMVLAPLIMAAAIFINGGIYHLMLMILKGANFPFETTFRVVAYTTGVTAMLALIPCVGGCASAIVQIVFLIMGLSSAQEISGGKASAAVLIPIGVCCVSMVLLYAAVAAFVLGQAGAFN